MLKTKRSSQVYKDTLEANGHEVDTADDGEVAFDKMKQGGYDLVLLDIILSKINGLLIMQKLKESSQVHKILIKQSFFDKS